MFELPTSAASTLEIIDRLSVDLGDLARELAHSDPQPNSYLKLLLREGLVRDARHFLAHALPRRRALWWACLCASDVLSLAEKQEDLSSSVKVVAEFVRWPGESRRRRAETIFRRQRSNTLAAQLAGAAFYSTGSIAPPEAHTHPAPPSVLGKFVSVSVYLAATRKNIRQYVHHMREYIHLGEQIALGQNLWPQDSPSEPSRLDRPHRAKALQGMHIIRPVEWPSADGLSKELFTSS